jgi:hypothetical protein
MSEFNLEEHTTGIFIGVGVCVFVIIVLFLLGLVQFGKEEKTICHEVECPAVECPTLPAFTMPEVNCPACPTLSCPAHKIQPNVTKTTEGFDARKLNPYY